MKTRISKNTLLLFLLLFAILLMGIGYSAINSITGEIKGIVIAESQTGVFITNVEDVSNVGADLTTSEIKHYKGTMMQSTVKLSDTNPASEITYKVTVYNNSENSYPFLAVLYDEEFYDNPNITFEISADGYKIGGIINPHETKDIYITFKYKDGVIPDSTVLNSYLNFKIANPNRMVLAEDVNSTGNYLESTVTKDKIETVSFKLGKTAPEGTVASFDASEKQDKSIIGYYTDTDGNGLYELTFTSDEPIFANINAQYLFQNLTSLKSISFDNFSTLSVTDMSSMFYDCSELTSLDVSKFDTSQGTNMAGMFFNCSGLTTLDVSNFDTSQATNMWAMFYNCNGLTTIDVSGFDTSQVTNMESMFNGCGRLTTIDVSKFDTSQVIYMAGMFFNCSGLTTLDVSNFDTSQATNMEGMFYNCSGLTTLDVNNFDTSQVKNMWAMFHNCNGLTTIDVSGFDTSKVTNMESMFGGCGGLTTIDVSGFDTSKVTNMKGMFYNCCSLTTLNVSRFDTSQVTNMEGMFGGCGGLTSLDVSGFNTSKVTSMMSMFNSCRGLTSLDVSKFNTNKVRNMSWMFEFCSELTSLDISGFDTIQVTDMQIMFGNCNKLITIYAREFDSTTNTGWTTSAVTSSNYMFSGCTKIVGGNGTTYDESHIDKEYARIDKTGTPGYFTNIKNEGVKPSEIFDMDGTNPDGLHIGDFVEYDAGTWTQEEINAIKTGQKSALKKANGSVNLPTQDYQFGGFPADLSRNGNATPVDEYDYVRDKTTGGPVTGWRVFDVDGDKVTLISAGNPEDYFNPYDVSYESEYILSGNVNSDWNETEAAKYQKRDWNNYVNTTQKAESATALTKSALDAWYTKYTNTRNADVSSITTFQKIYSTAKYRKYQNMIDNYTSYWLATADEDSNLHDVTADIRHVGSYCSIARGVRVLVTLSPDVLFTSEKVGTKTVMGGNTTAYGGPQTYNVWKIDSPEEIEPEPEPVKPSQVFDLEGTNSDGLHIGDFVNYDAGIWTQEEIKAIKTGKKTSLVTANGSTDLPIKGFQFGGFQAGLSRNGNATSCSDVFGGDYEHLVKDKSIGGPITGWRVFDVDGDKITLISAGNPEDYYHPNESSYISEYILSGNVNSEWNEEEAAKYQKRDWSNYVNTEQKGESATVLSKNKLDAWYTKYTNTAKADTSNDTTFRKIYSNTKFRKYQNMIENYSYYWLSNDAGDNNLFHVDGYVRNLNKDGSCALGLRILVTLSSDVIIGKTTEIKKVIGGNTTAYGGEQAYNVWDIK